MVNGTTKVSGIAKRWSVEPETVRAVLKEADIRPVEMSPARYALRDIIAFEGIGYIPKHLIEEILRPLLTPVEVQRRYFPDDSARAIRDRSQAGRLPGVKIGKQWRFYEHLVREACLYE